MKSRFTLALFFVLVLKLAAQDVTVSGLSWVDPHDPPDTLPSFKEYFWAPQKPYYPERLKGSPEIGYIIFTPFIDASGKLVVNQEIATDELLKNDIIDSMDWRSGWHFKPALRNGQPVNSLVRFTVIFNPACSSQKKPDATPRLLSLVAPEVSRAQAKKYAQRPKLYVTASIDAVGHVTKAVADAGSPDELGPLAEAAVLKWTFAPARQNSQPVAQDVRVPVLFIVPVNFDETADSPPRVVHRERPLYPRALIMAESNGEVTLNFVVDIEGRVRNPVVVASTNPFFDQPALDAIMKWRFEPGTRKGVPVSTRITQNIVFSVKRNGMDVGEEPYHVDDDVDQSKLPPELRFDIPPKPANTVFAVYPFELLRDRVEGSAEIRFLVGPDGSVAQSTVVKATRPEFGLALIAMLDEWKFQPAMKGGKPTWAPMDVKQVFWHSGGADVPVSSTALELLWELKREKPDFCPIKELDAKPQMLSRHPPVFPSALNGKVAGGQAVVEFLIDHDGNVQLPRVVSATDPAFGYAAVQGVAAWKFAPPTSHGKPVVVRAQIPVKFTAPAPKPAPAAAAPPAQN
ncbi:MAG TPA: TonB family protein [Opitutaceae bacterium]|nr:TonB family protein [Opitutaceae bacterium]